VVVEAVLRDDGSLQPVPERTAEEAAECARRAGLRARAKVRRYSRANGLSRLWTLTFAPENLPSTRAGVMVEGAAFIKRLRAHLGRPIPYVLVPERGTKNTMRWHLHLALGFYIPKGEIERLWGLGFVDARAFEGGADPRSSASKVAHYVSKYVEKTFEDVATSTGRRNGEHRYEVGQGFQPECVEVEDQGDELEALATAVALVGEGMPTWCWSSESIENWPGPPLRVLRW
jgi:hypothetical protein